MSNISTINPPPPNTHLTADDCQKIGGALARLNEIKNESVVVSLHGVNQSRADKNEQEARDLIEYLSLTLITHAPELVGCWFVVKGEYNPLIQSLVPLVQRINANLAAQEKRNTPHPSTSDVE